LLAAFGPSQALVFGDGTPVVRLRRHGVLDVQAAIVGSANQIVTFNLADFPATLAQHSVEAIHPDDFFLNVLDLHTPQVVAAVQEQSADLNRPPLTVFDIIRAFSKSGCPNFAQELANRERAD
jgi:hypothetical protein